MVNAGKVLRELRLRSGLTQHQVAARLKISRNAYIAWEKNQVALTISRLTALCVIFDITVAEFFEPKQAPRSPDQVALALQKAEEMALREMELLRQQNKEIIRLNRKLERLIASSRDNEKKGR